MSKIHYGLGSVTATNWSVYAPGSVYTPNLPMVTPRVDYRGLRPLRIDSWGASASGDYWVQCVYNGGAIGGGATYSTYPSSVYLIRVYANSGSVSPGRQTGSGYRMYWDSDGDSVDGGIVSWIYYTEAPSAPTLVSVTPQNGTEAVVVISAPADGGGDPVNASTTYTIQYATNSNFTAGVGQAVVTGAGSHTVTGLTAGQTYYWRTMMRNGLTNALGTLGGAVSGTLSALQGQEPQNAPGLSVTSSLSGSSANFSLTPPSNTGGAPITGYDLEYRLIGGSATQFFSASQTGNRAGLAQGQVYEWRARARNVVGAGPWSNWITVTQNQTSLDVGAYFDGSSEDVSDTSFSWDGTTNNSTSSATGVGVLGWRTFAECNGDSGGTGVVAQVNSGIVGPKAARVIFKSDATAEGFIAGPYANATDGAAVEAGTTYFGSIMVRPSRDVRLAAVIVWVDGVGGSKGRTIGQFQLVGEGQARRLVVAGAAPAGAAYGAANVIDAVSEVGDRPWWGGDYMDVDAAMMSLANYPYIDGSLSDTARYEYFWQGTPHNSVSWREDLGEAPRAIVDPDCPPVPSPPRPPIIENSCIEEIEDWRRYWMQISAVEMPAWRTTLPTLELRPVFEDIRQMRVRYYPDPEGLGWDQMDPNAFCAEGIISYIPLGSTMIVDGITGRIWIEQDGEMLPADHLVYGSDGGPHILPYLDGGIAYLVSVDTPQDSPIGNLEFDVSLTWRM